jgi:chromosome segregation ATPase
MSSEILRQFARDFTAAAEGLEKYATLGQAVTERTAEIGRLDAKIAAARQELADIQSKAAEVSANIATVDDEFRRTMKSRQEALDAHLEQRKQAADIKFNIYAQNAQMAIDAKREDHRRMENEVVRLREIHDSLQQEINAAKHRVSAL